MKDSQLLNSLILGPLFPLNDFYTSCRRKFLESHSFGTISHLLHIFARGLFKELRKLDYFFFFGEGIA